MQFKHPEILWFFLLLLIPILVHLFQLRRFKSTPFTNVDMLQQVVSESRKSNTLKKWLLLAARLLLLTCLILAFAQPFKAKKSALQPTATVIYLDDSFSMQTSSNAQTLLGRAVQELLQTLPPTAVFDLFTNNRTFEKVTIPQVQNELLRLKPHNKALTFDQIQFKAQSLFPDGGAIQKNLIIISDFQQNMGPLKAIDSTIRILPVQLRADTPANTAIDSISLIGTNTEQLRLEVFTSGSPNEGSHSLALDNKGRLIAKTTIETPTDGSTLATLLSLPANERILGRLQLNDPVLDYDNTFYFVKDKRPRIKVLSVVENPSGYLARIFTQDEFEFQEVKIGELSYSDISDQNLLVLNRIKNMPNNLLTTLDAFLKNGGHLIVVPHEQGDLTSYNALLKPLSNISLEERIEQQLEITGITFDHPLFQGVFNRKVSNFNFPTVNSFYSISGSGTSIMTYANQNPFLVQQNNVMLFTSGLGLNNSNFQESPLIVPLFYKMALASLQLPPSYFTLGEQNQLDIATNLTKDQIIKLAKDGAEYIPPQRSFANKVTLTLGDNLKDAGIYAIIKNSDTLQYLAVNYPRNESNLSYLQPNSDEFPSIYTQVTAAFQKISEERSIDAYWKWFVIFALVFAIVELLIQKFIA